MSEMVERVARALAYHNYNTEDVWESHISDARATIQAMREPTEEMISASYEDGATWSDMARGYVADEWRRMIDAALKDHSNPVGNVIDVVPEA